MPKIDTSTIEGYGDMTAEQKLKALESYEITDNAAELERYKVAATKANSEAADFKRQLKARMSEDEQHEAERQAKEQEREDQLQALLKDKKISEDKARFLALGYDDTLATDTAKALSEGDINKVVANQKTHLENVQKNLKADLLKNTPTPPAGDTVLSSGDFTKKIEDATKNQDFALMASLMRQQQELDNNLKE